VRKSRPERNREPGYRPRVPHDDGAESTTCSTASVDRCTVRCPTALAFPCAFETLPFSRAGPSLPWAYLPQARCERVGRIVARVVAALPVGLDCRSPSRSEPRRPTCVERSRGSTSFGCVTWRRPLPECDGCRSPTSGTMAACEVVSIPRPISSHNISSWPAPAVFYSQPASVASSSSTVSSNSSSTSIPHSSGIERRSAT